MTGTEARVGVRGPGSGVPRNAGAAASVVLAGLVTVLCGAAANAQTPTPGPVERAGRTVDTAVLEVRDELAEVALAARVRIALLETLKDGGLRVNVSVRGGRVELSGQVPTAPERELAEGAARRVEGVTAVVNAVTLMTSPPPETAASRAIEQAGRAVADAILEASVKLRLLDDVGRVAFAIEVGAASGAVTLTGEVPDEARRTLALKAARATSGVTSVKDALRVAAAR